MQEIALGTYVVRVKKCFPAADGHPVYRIQYKPRYWWRRWRYHTVSNALDWTPYWTESYDKALVEAKIIHAYLNEKDDRRRYTYIAD